MWRRVHARENDLSLQGSVEVTYELGREGRVGFFQKAERERDFRKRKELRQRTGDEVPDLFSLELFASLSTL